MKGACTRGLAALWLGALSVLVACSNGGNKPATSPSPASSTTPPTGANQPALALLAPTGNLVPQIGDVTIIVQVTEFNVIGKEGQPVVKGQGHLHYYMDVTPPTDPGQAAITAAGTWVSSVDSAYTWHNVPGGSHTFSVQLVNNDHTPLVPPVVLTKTLLVVPEIGPPQAVIATPRDGANPPAGPVTITVQTSNFNIMDKLGMPNVQREGHIHYFMDVEPPTTPGQAAATEPGTYADVTTLSYTWKDVPVGKHTFSIELVNNDHTPLQPPVVRTISVTVMPGSEAKPPETSAPPATTTSPY